FIKPSRIETTNAFVQPNPELPIKITSLSGDSTIALFCKAVDSCHPTLCQMILTRHTLSSYSGQDKRPDCVAPNDFDVRF
ncbi:MAG: hypothetical protein MHMPM18_004865, partial [Marteilia pararefringens]